MSLLDRFLPHIDMEKFFDYLKEKIHLPNFGNFLDSITSFFPDLFKKKGSGDESSTDESSTDNMNIVESAAYQNIDFIAQNLHGIGGAASKQKLQNVAKTLLEKDLDLTNEFTTKAQQKIPDFKDTDLSTQEALTAAIDQICTDNNSIEDQRVALTALGEVLQNNASQDV